MPLLLATAASPPAVELNWTAPAECPSEMSLRRELARRLARAAPPERPLVADAQVYRGPQGFVLDLHLRGPTDGEPVRRYERASCRDLGEMAVEEVYSASPGRHTDAGGPSPPPAPAAARPHPNERPPPPTERPPSHTIPGALRLGGIVGAAPNAGAVLGGPTLDLAFLGPRWRVELGALYLRTAASSYRVAMTEERIAVAVAWEVAAGQLTACGAALARSDVSLYLCAGGELGVVLGHATRTAAPRRRHHQPWLAAQAAALLTVRLGPRVHLWLSGAPVLARPPTSEVVVSATEAESRALELPAVWWQFRGALGVEVRWGI